MKSLEYEFRSEFLRRYVAQGIAQGVEQGLTQGVAQGRTEARIEIILKVLMLRFGLLTADLETRVRGAQDEQLDAVIERMLTAQSLEEALGPLA